MLWNRNLLFALDTLVGDKHYLYQESSQGLQLVRGGELCPVVFQDFSE